MNGLCVRKGQHTRHGHERGTKSGSGAYVAVARFRLVSCRAMSEPLREKIKFALRLQPGETAAALDGDAHSIRPLAFFARKVAPEWLDSMMQAELYCEHPSAEESAPLKGINMLCAFTSGQLRSCQQWIRRSIVAPTIRVAARMPARYTQHLQNGRQRSPKSRMQMKSSKSMFEWQKERKKESSPHTSVQTAYPSPSGLLVIVCRVFG